jgi:hypothetical protein
MAPDLASVEVVCGALVLVSAAAWLVEVACGALVLVAAAAWPEDGLVLAAA